MKAIFQGSKQYRIMGAMLTTIAICISQTTCCVEKVKDADGELRHFVYQKVGAGMDKGDWVVYQDPHEPLEPLEVGKIQASAGEVVIVEAVSGARGHDRVPEGHCWIQRDKSSKLVSYGLVIGTPRAVVWPWEKARWLGPESQSQTPPTETPPPSSPSTPSSPSPSSNTATDQKEGK